MSCIKTGCDIAFADNLTCIYRGDAFYFEGIILFKVRVPTYQPHVKPDFIIDVECPFICDDILASKAGNIILKSQEIATSWLKYCPDMLTKVILDV